MSKEPVLVRSNAKKKTSNFMCRKGTHEWSGLGGIDSEEDTLFFRWCTTCGCLEETSSASEDVKIRVPDTGI